MAKSPAFQLATNVWRIPTLPFDFLNTFAFVEDDGQVSLVDAGVKKSAKRIVAGLAAMGKTPSDVTRIVLTHAHADHAGGAAALAGLTSSPVAISAIDAPWAREGRNPPRDDAQRTGRLLNRYLERGRNTFPSVTVAEEFADGDALPIAGGLRVVHTPGHTPGHVSLLHSPTGVLVTGDSIWNVRKMSFGVRGFCTDYVENVRTSHVLGEMEYDVAAFTHGPHVSVGARETVRSFLKSASERK